MLRGEIKYTKTPLPEAFASIAVRIKEPFGSFLEQTAEQMGSMEGQSFGELWQKQIKQWLSDTHLKKGDKEQLGGLGEVLGYLDLEMQLSSIDLYLEQLELSIREAQDAAQTKQKLYQSLGVAGGIFLVILLVYMEEPMSVNLIFKIAAVGILVSVLSQILKHSGREEQAFLTSLAGLVLVLFWILPYIFDTMQRLFAL